MQDLLQNIWKPEDRSILLSIHGVPELYFFEGFAPQSSLMIYIESTLESKNTPYINQVLSSPSVKAYGVYCYGVNPAKLYYLHFLGSSCTPSNWRNKSETQIDSLVLTKAIAESAALLRALPDTT